MNLSTTTRRISRTVLLLIWAGAAVLAQESPPLKEGAKIEWGGRVTTIKKLDALPCVESEFTRRFRFVRTTRGQPLRIKDPSWKT